jgi:hypothetical protein
MKKQVSNKVKAEILKLFVVDGKTIAEIAMLVHKPIPIVATVIKGAKL